MRSYPDHITIKDEDYAFEKILKDDFFSVNVLYRSEKGVRYVLKLSDFRFIFGKLLLPLAAFFSWREYRIYSRIADVAGIPELGPRLGMRGYFHRFVEGSTLFEVRKQNIPLPEDFFIRLRAIIDELHRRRIFYLDLNKLGNIILGDDGYPWLIDFQVSIYFRKRTGPAGRLGDRLFQSLIREDIYHIYKHKRRFQPDLLTEEESVLAKRTGFNTWYDRFLGSPYRRVKRLIYPSGSNEIIWYKWKKMKDRDRRMP